MGAPLAAQHGEHVLVVLYQMRNLLGYGALASDRRSLCFKELVVHAVLLGSLGLSTARPLDEIGLAGLEAGGAGIVHVGVSLLQCVCSVVAVLGVRIIFDRVGDRLNNVAKIAGIAGLFLILHCFITNSP